MPSFSFDAEPKSVMDYIHAKKPEISFDHDEIMRSAHHRAFTVAKVTKLELLADIQESLVDAAKNGKPFARWRDEIKPTLQKKGWWGKTEAFNPRTGEIKDIYIGSSRLKTIYDTNMRVAYAQSRYETQMRSDADFLRYSAVLDRRTRPAHAALHGIVLRKTDPFWDTNYPPNGWGCRCQVRAYTAAQVSSRGWTPKKGSDVPDIAEKGWEYNPGAAKYSVEKNYYDKVSALWCRSKNARIREVLCPFIERVKAGYVSDMKKLLPTQKEWDEFVDRALDKNIKRHEEMRLGYLSMIPSLQGYLGENVPTSDLILADTGSIRNLKAKGDESVSSLKRKGGKNTLSTDDIKQLISLIHTPAEAYFDGHILLLYRLSKSAKIVIGIDIGDRKRVYNTLHSGQLYDNDDDLRRAISGADRLL